MIELFTLKNGKGMKAVVSNYGARLTSLFVPGRNGVLFDVVLGFDKPEDYMLERNANDFGAVIGRYANRIGQGRFALDGKIIQLPQNNGPHCLHGGPKGWQYQFFSLVEKNDNSLILSLLSEDGDNGFPGSVNVKVCYRLSEDNALQISYEAHSDSPTVINMTNHSYFNLNDNQNQLIYNHLLKINADKFFPIDETFLPTGEIVSVEGTPMDFRQLKPICSAEGFWSADSKVNNDFGYKQLRMARGYDHNWLLNTRGDDAQCCAVLENLETGVQMKVFTTEPGMQVYTANFLDGSVMGKNGVRYQQHSAICLETQKYPDSPNRKWPESNAFLYPNQPYSSRTTYKFELNDGEKME